MKQLELAPLQNLAPTLLSSQEAAAVKQDATVAKQDTTATEQDINAVKTLAELLLPISAVDWRRIEIFREKLQQEAIEMYSCCNK